MKTLNHKQQRMHALINAKGNIERYDYRKPNQPATRLYLANKVAKALGHIHDVY